MRFHDFTDEYMKAQLIMEYCQYGSLWRHIFRNDLSHIETAQILLDGLSALAYMHDRPIPISHCDISASNILVAQRGDGKIVIKLSDFGTARQAIDFNTPCGTRIYLAPECWKAVRITTAADIWSFGVVCLSCGWQLSERRASNMSGLEWCRMIIRKANHENSQDMHPLGKALIAAINNHMMQEMPESRQTATALLKTGLNDVREQLRWAQKEFEQLKYKEENDKLMAEFVQPEHLRSGDPEPEPEKVRFQSAQLQQDQQQQAPPEPDNHKKPRANADEAEPAANPKRQKLAAEEQDQATSAEKAKQPMEQSAAADDQKQVTATNKAKAPKGTKAAKEAQAAKEATKGKKPDKDNKEPGLQQHYRQLRSRKPKE